MRHWRAVVTRDAGGLGGLERQARVAILFLLGFAVAVVYFASARSKMPLAERQIAKTQDVQAQPVRAAKYSDALPIARAVPGSDRWTDPVPAHARVNERHAANVGSPVRGRITQVFVQTGQSVRTGSPLFAVAGPDVPDVIARYERASLELAAAKEAEDRVVPLVRAEAIPAKDETSAKHRVAQARLALRAASAKIKRWNVAKGKAGELIIKSPSTGVVIEKKILAGQVVDAGEPGLVVVADVSTIWVVAELLESDVHSVNPGTRARVVFTSKQETEFETTVEAVSPVVDRDRHSVWVRMELENHRGRLRPNAMARVRFLTAAPPSSVEIPSSAVATHGRRHVVYVQDEKRGFARRSVTVGATREGLTIVTSGLVAGDPVVERGAVLLDNDLALIE